MSERERTSHWRPVPPVDRSTPDSVTIHVRQLEDRIGEFIRRLVPGPDNRFHLIVIYGLVVLALAVATTGALLATSGGSGHGAGVHVSSGPQPGATADASALTSLWTDYLPTANQSSQSLSTAEAQTAQQRQQAANDASVAAQDSSGAGCSFIPTNPNPYMECRAQGEQQASSEQAAESAAQSALDADVAQVTTAGQSWIGAITDMLKGWGKIRWVAAAVTDETTFYANASNLRDEIQSVLAATTSTSATASTSAAQGTSSEVAQLTSAEATLVTAQAALQHALQSASR